jgi:CRP-like cAMP-binding protein
VESPLQLSSVKYQKDAYITVEGKSNADRFYIIQQGKVAVSKEVEVAKEENKILNPGDFFGVISTMSNHSHIETAQALTEVVMIAVQRDQYGALIQKNALVAMKIITQFSKRLRFLNETLAGISMKKTADIGPDYLFEVAEYYFKQKQYSKAIHVFNRYLKHCPGGAKAAAAKERIESLRKTHAIGSIKEVEEKPNDLKRSYPKDYLLCVEGEPGNEMFIIQSGSVKITKITSDNEVLLAVLKTGDIFGEMALLEGKPRGATAMAYDECEVMVINKANFEQMIKTQPQLIARVTGLLADRIWLIYKQLANTLIDDPVGRMYDSLFIQLEKNRVPLDDQKPYLFSFGQWELANMVGLPEKEARPVVAKFMDNKKIEIVDGKIRSPVQEVVKQAEYYRKMDKIKKDRAKSQKERA